MTLIKNLNEELEKQGLLPIMIVDPNDCVGAVVNARYFLPEKFQVLVDNVISDGRLESVPLVWIDPTLEDGKYRIVSGHHRIDAAKAAGLKKIMVLVAKDVDNDSLISKQLSHNALTGTDDAVILQQLFDSIQDIGLRFATGLSDKIDKISYPTINFKVGTFKQFSILFIPDQIEDFDRVIGEINASGNPDIRLSPINEYKEFIAAIMRIKRLENIKSNGIALSRLVELANKNIKTDA